MAENSTDARAYGAGGGRISASPEGGGAKSIAGGTVIRAANAQTAQVDAGLLSDGFCFECFDAQHEAAREPGSWIIPRVCTGMMTLKNNASKTSSAMVNGRRIGESSSQGPAMQSSV